WKGARESLRTSTAGAEPRGFTLLELVGTLAVIALAAGLVLPRLGDARGLALGAAARRLADTLAYARDRAILGGRPMRLVLDLDRGRWELGTPARDPAAVIPDVSPLGRGTVLPAGVRLAAVTAGGTPAATRGIAALDLEPDGDALPARIDLADASGRRASVGVPPAGARPGRGLDAGGRHERRLVPGRAGCGPARRGNAGPARDDGSRPRVRGTAHSRARGRSRAPRALPR